MGACRSNGETVMDAKNTIIKPWPKQGLSEHVRAAPAPFEPRPSREQAEAAVRTLIAYAGDNPDREGLLETPKRVIGAYEELYQGYRECPVEVLDRTFSETGGYDDFVLVKDISFNSHCEHHMMPFYGKAHVAARGGKARRDNRDDAFHRRIPRGCQRASPFHDHAAWGATLSPA